MTAPRKYDKEFRQRAVDRFVAVYESLPYREPAPVCIKVAEDLNVARSTLEEWVQAVGKWPRPQWVEIRALETDKAALEVELAELRQQVNAYAEENAELRARVDRAEGGAGKGTDAG